MAPSKKSPAQLQRDIDAVLANPGAYSYEEAMDALAKRHHAGVKRGGSLRAGHAPVAPKMTSAKDDLFVGTFATGISYADRSREKNGDYVRLAFLPFRTLELEWSRVRMSPEMRKLIVADAKRLQARRGESYQVSTSGQTVKLGG